MISIPHVKEDQYTLLTEFYLDQNGLFSIDKAVIIENYHDDKTIQPQDTNKDFNMQTEAPEEKKLKPKFDKNKKERVTNCVIKQVSSSYGHDTATMANMIQREANQESDDLTLKYTKDKRNEIESFIYSTKEKLKNELLDYTFQSEAESVLKILHDSETWLYNNHEETYNKAIMEEIYLKTTVPANKIYKRKSDWENLEIALNFLKNCINNNISRYKSQISHAKDKKVLLNQKEVEEISKLIKSYSDIYHENLKSVEKCPKSINCPLNHENVTKIASDLEDKVNRVFVDAEKRVKETEKLIEEKKKNQQKGKFEETKEKTIFNAKSDPMDLN